MNERPQPTHVTDDVTEAQKGIHSRLVTVNQACGPSESRPLCTGHTPLKLAFACANSLADRARQLVSWAPLGSEGTLMSFLNWHYGITSTLL